LFELFELFLYGCWVNVSRIILISGCPLVTLVTVT
jgi:hypothetical protein